MGIEKLCYAVAGFALTAALVACHDDKSAPKQPESSAPITDTASASPLPSAAPSPAASTSASDTAVPSGKSIKETLGTIAKAEVTGKVSTTMTKQADIDALLAAIGTDQVPSGPHRRCPDVVVVALQDAAGATKGSVGICSYDSLGPEFFTGPKYEDRNGITLADEAAFRKLLKLPAMAPSADDGAKH